MFLNIDIDTERTLQECGMPSPGACFGSKSGYAARHKDDNFAFNARMVVNNRILWWGDLNVTESQSAIDLVAKTLQETVYICRESAAWSEDDISLDRPVYVATP